MSERTSQLSTKTTIIDRQTVTYW